MERVIPVYQNVGYELGGEANVLHARFVIARVPVARAVTYLRCSAVGNSGNELDGTYLPETAASS